MRVLVVDDNEELLQFFLLTLEDAGIQATGARNSQDGLAKVAEEKFDVAVIDSTLGDTDGIDCAQQMRALKNGRSIKILIMSTFTTPLARRMALGVGCNELIVKPCSANKWLDCIMKLG